VAVRILVTDLGRVLLPFDTAKPMRLLAEASRHPDAIARLGAVVRETGFGRGEIDPEALFVRARDAMGLQVDFSAFCRLYSDMFSEDWATVALVRSARVEKRILLSNTNAIHWDWILANHGEVLQGLDHLCVSHEIGAEKPDPAVFRHVEALTGGRPEEHLFLDDIPAYAEGAAAAGWAAHVHTDSDALRAALEKHGLLPA
jgi:putative hydrolase of the HAD superfamily